MVEGGYSITESRRHRMAPTPPIYEPGNPRPRMGWRPGYSMTSKCRCLRVSSLEGLSLSPVWLAGILHARGVQPGYSMKDTRIALHTGQEDMGSPGYSTASPGAGDTAHSPEAKPPPPLSHIKNNQGIGAYYGSWGIPGFQPSLVYPLVVVDV